MGTDATSSSSGGDRELALRGEGARHPSPEAAVERAGAGKGPDFEETSREEAVAPHGLSPREFAAAVVAELSTRGALRPETLAQVSDVIERFGTFLEISQGIIRIGLVGEEHALAFIDSRRVGGRPVSHGLRRIRRMALRMAFRAGRQMGIVRGDPTIDIQIGPKSHLPARPLTDEEMQRGRSYALRSLTDLRRSIAWALAEATARTSEIGRVRVGDVDAERSKVRLPGSSTVDARLGSLSNWGVAQVHRRLEEARDADESLIVWRSPPKTLRAASSQAITETLRAVGLHGPDVRPRSIVAWAGRKALRDGAPVETVASMLGMRSLDQTADFVCFRWREGEQP
jgi:integrase